MTKSVRIINPTLPENISIVIALAKSEYGNNPGLLEHYTVYSLGENESYALTLPVLQLIADPTTNANVPPVRLDVFEPYREGNGNFGNIYPVIRSIIPDNDTGVFDDSGSYIIKEMIADQKAPTDKPNKPNWYVRIANKQQYFGGQHPTLGMHYALVKREKTVFLHMNRAPGLSLDRYRNKLSGEQFLSLACTLLEEAPRQIHRIVNAGKRKGRVMIHCDLKPENIMAAYVNGEWIVTVIDMGLVKTIEENGHYSTIRPYGNQLVWDGEMIRAEMNNQPKTYDIQSDIYALFVCICELAGAPSREDLTNEEALMDIENPNFMSIFSTMNFDENMKKQLEQAIRGALRANKMQRTPHNEVLTVFQNALTEVQKNNLMSRPQVTMPHQNTVQVTAEGLRQWVEQPLDNIALTAQNNGQDRKTILKSWLVEFRKRYSLASQEEKELFNALFRKGSNLRISSPFIFNLLRFNLLNEYNDDACVRLLLRHEQLIAPLKAEQVLPEPWQKRFQVLSTFMSLQLTKSHADQCTELGQLKLNISNYSKQQISERAPKLFHFMQEELAQQMQLGAKEWLQQLPEFAKLFNKQYKCIVITEQLRKKITPLFSLTKDLKQQFAGWGLMVFRSAMEGSLPENLEEYFAHYSLLIELLTHIDTKRQAIVSLFGVLPKLNQSSINWSSIEESIEKLQLGDLSMVIALSQKLEILLLIHDVYACLNDPDNQDYDVIIQTNLTKLTTLIDQLVEQTLPEKEIKTQLKEIINHFEDLDEVAAFMEQCQRYPHIQNAIEILLDSNYKIDELANAMRSNLVNAIMGKSESKDLSLRNLNDGLKVIFSKGNNSSTQNESFFSEMTRFFAIPLMYRAPIPTTSPTPKIYSQANLNPMFLLPPKDEKDEITKPFHFRQ